MRQPTGRPLAFPHHSWFRHSCPDSEVRTHWRHTLMRTSESKGHEQLYDSSAPFEPEVRNRGPGKALANFGFGARVSRLRSSRDTGGTFSCELRNQRDTRNPIILVPLLNPKFAIGVAARLSRTSGSGHWRGIVRPTDSSPVPGRFHGETEDYCQDTRSVRRSAASRRAGAGRCETGRRRGDRKSTRLN